MALTSKYELLFLMLDLGTEKDAGLKRYARRRILMHVGLSVRRLERFHRRHAADLMRIQTRAEFDRLLREACGPE